MRVYYVHSGLQGCYFVRCLLPMQANGWDGDITTPLFENRSDESRAMAAQNSDVIVFHRPDDPRKLELAKRLKHQHGKKIIFDNDDTFKDDGGFKFNEYMDRARMERGLKRINSVIDEFIHDVADVVTCSTDFLNAEYSQLHSKVITLPNTVDPFYFDEPLRNETDVLRVGVIGSVAITSDFEPMKEVIKHFNDDPKVQFVVYSLPPPNFSKITNELYAAEYRELAELNIEWHPFTPQPDYFDKINSLRLDLSFVPRADTYFNRCKSNLKFLELSMFEVPTLAQSFPTGDGPYQQNPADKDHLELCANPQEFIERIEHYKTHRDELRALGAKAREYVINNYHIEKHAHKWEDAYKL